jgi:hypothetical protein
MNNNYATTMAGLGTGLQGAQLAQGQAQIGAGTIHQQTQQAQDQAVYNQFLQKQGYPFQVAQFLANIATGTGALSGSTTQGSTNSPQPFFSDERLKEDIRTIGHTKDGLRIVSYRYKGSPHTQIGMLAQDVEKKRPEAVGLAGGYKTVDYDAATRKALGGALANDNDGYAEGGSVPGFDQQALAQMLVAHQAMYPGAGHDRAGITGGTGPRGMQLVQMPNRTLNAPKLPEAPPQRETGLKTATNAMSGLGSAISNGKTLYKEGKEALGAISDKYNDIVHGKIDDQIADWSKYGANAGAPAAAAADAAATVAPAATEAVAPAATEIAAAIPAEDMVGSAMSLFAARGGRARRAAGGGMPFGGSEGYLPSELFEPENTKELLDEQKGLGAADKAAVMKAPSKEGGGGGSGGAGKGIGSLLGMGVGAMFGMPGIGSMVGGMAGSMFNKGGRAGYATEGAVEELPVGLSPNWAPDPTLEDVPLKAVPDNVIPFRPKTGLSLPPKPEREMAGPPEPAGPPIGLAPPPREPAGPPAPPPSGAAPTGVASPPTGLAPTPVPAAASPSAPPPLPPPQTVKGDDFDHPDNVMQRAWWQESRHQQFRSPGVPLVSSAGAVGYTQMQAAGPEAAALAGVPYDKHRLAHDVEYNKLLGTTWMRHLQQKYGDPYKAAAAYNAGTGAMKNALEKAAAQGGNYWDYLPAETQGYLDFVSGGKYGKPGQGSQQRDAMSIVQNGGASSLRQDPAPPHTEAISQATGLDPSRVADLQTPPKTAQKGDWLDRNERYLVTGLTFLGNMLASPSHQLLGSIGHGIAAAAPVYAELGFKERASEQQQQQIQLGGQRNDIQQRAQNIALLTQLRTMQNARLGRGLPEDPQLAAQIAHLAKITAGGPSPTGPSGAGALTGLMPAPATPPAPIAPPPTPPVTVQATPPTAGQPAGTPPAGGPPQPVSPELAARFPALKELPPQISSPEFKARINPEEDPVELYRRANAMTDDGDDKGQYRTLVARADAAMQRLRSGYVLDRDMKPILVPGMAQTQHALQMIPQNKEWSEKERVASIGRTASRQSLDLVRHALEEYQSNALADVSTKVQSMANAVGLGALVPNGAKMNAAMVQEIIKQSAAAAGGADTDMGRQLLRMSSIDPAKEPEANKQILAQSYAALNAADARYNYLQPRISAVPQLDTPLETQQWLQQNPPKKFYEEAYNDIAVRGATPDDLSKIKVGSTHIVEPGSAIARTLSIPINKPTRLRRVERDGQMGWEVVR